MPQRLPDRETLNRYFDSLGVSPLATEAEIRAAYRRLAMQHHPDRNAGREAETAEVFKGIKQAYEQILMWRSRTACRVDEGGTAAPVDSVWEEVRRYARAAKEKNASRARGDVEPAKSAAKGIPLAGILKTPLEVALFGGVAQGIVGYTVPCKVCASERPASLAYPRAKCEVCQQSGRQLCERQFPVQLNPGVTDQALITVSAQGLAGPAGVEKGNAFLTVEIQPHPRFTRQGLDVVGPIEVDYASATLGGPLLVEVLGQGFEIQLPENTPAGLTLRLRGKGLRGPNGGQGDLCLSVVLTQPSKIFTLTTSQRLPLYAALAPLRS